MNVLPSDVSSSSRLTAAAEAQEQKWRSPECRCQVKSLRSPVSGAPGSGSSLFLLQSTRDAKTSYCTSPTSLIISHTIHLLPRRICTTLPSHSVFYIPFKLVRCHKAALKAETPNQRYFSLFFHIYVLLLCACSVRRPGPASPHRSSVSFLTLKAA